MSGHVRILRITSGLFKEKATIEAQDACEKTYDSLLGLRDFYLNEGSRTQVKVPRGMYAEGEVVRFNQICTSSNAFDFPWQWSC